MAKKAAKSKKSLPSSSASTSVEAVASPKRASKKKLALTVKSNEKVRRSTRRSAASVEKENRPEPAAKPKTAQKKKPGKVVTKMPKKPPTAFFYFLEDFRKEYQLQNPDVKSMRDIGKACGEKWKTMTYEEKVKYYDIATEKRAEYERAMAEYTKRKELGEYQESEDDTDFSE